MSSGPTLTLYPTALGFWDNFAYEFIRAPNGQVQYIRSMLIIISKLQDLYFYPRLTEKDTENWLR